ncbi:MAG: tetratricopeptide repeat protein [Vicinamibacterales bacterium]|nr:tetratricopeptide repeat protein [Vicinamibacterales bacterium]
MADRFRSVLLASCFVLASACPITAGAQSVTIVIPPTGLAREAWQALEEGRFKDAEPVFNRALRATPDQPVLLLGAGIVARRLGRVDEARTAFTRALEVEPGLTAASLLLGMMLHEQGDLAGAIRVYASALFRAPDHPQLLAHLERWRKEAAAQEGFLRADGGHFTVLFEGPAEETLAQAAVDILEEAYHRIGDALIYYPVNPITVVLYTQEQFRDIARSPSWAGGLYDGRIKVPIRGALRNRAELARVLTHEYVHAVVHRLAPTNVPTWLNEGLAVYLEREDVPDARPSTSARPASLRGLSSSFRSLPADQVKAAYLHSGSAVRAIVDRVGLPAVVALLTDLGRGESFEEAFAVHVQMSFDDFQREWAEGAGTGAE